MRPIKLTLSAFGPYATETVLDMEHLGKSGLYIIAGETGAGKTTIFDGITYALYGKASGGNRQPSMFRSQCATTDTPTYVALEFECKEKIYHITRNPSYKRPSKRGDGMVTEKANAELSLPEAGAITGERAVTEAVEKIIGIDYERFCGIAMIAQGEFQKLLIASTEEREKIFRQIFHTHCFERFQKKLLEEAKSLNSACRKKRDGIQQELSLIREAEDELLQQDIQKAKNNELPMEDILALLQNLTDTDDRKITKLRQRLETLSKEKDDITAVIEKATTLASAKEALEKDLAALPAQREAAEKAKAAHAAEEENRPRCEELQCRITLAKKDLPQYDQLAKKARELQRRQKELQQEEATIKEQQTSMDELKKAEEGYRKELEAIKDCDKNLLSLEHGKEEAEHREEELKDIEERLLRCEKQEKKLKKAQEAYIKADQSRQKAEENYRRLDRLYWDHFTGVLAADLREDQPCPVCGSLHHPAPAPAAEDAPTEKQRKDAEKQQKQARDDAEKAGNEAGTEKATLKAHRDELEKACNARSIPTENTADFLREHRKEIEEAIRRFQQDIRKAEGECQRKKELEEKLLPQTKKNINRLAEEIQQRKTELKGMETDFRNLEEQIEQLRRQLPYKTGKEAEAALAQITEELHTLEQNYNAAKKCDEEAREALTRLQSRIDANQSIARESISCDLNKEREKQALLRKEEQEIHDRLEQLTSRRDIHQTILQNITVQSDELIAMEENYRWVNTLSETANGNLQRKGKEKIKLETYVQMTYFDRILRRANLRLMTMTNGQYDFKRAKEGGDKRSQTGLELNVIDHYNGTERSVRTLSGGESFKASLSLALGLADEIRSSAGGIRIDTMFVDEGFGSLDEASLQQAIKALQGLTEGQRLVGIISHVGELREKIEKQIIVRKTKIDGSTVQILC